MRATYDEVMATLGFPQDPHFRAQVERAYYKTEEEMDRAKTYIPLLQALCDSYMQIIEAGNVNMGDDPLDLEDFLEWFSQYQREPTDLHLELVYIGRIWADESDTEASKCKRVFRLFTTAQTLTYVALVEETCKDTEGNIVTLHSLEPV